MRQWIVSSVLLGGMISSLAACGASAHNLRTTELRCESVSTPLAVEEPQPSFSWTYTGEWSRGVIVSAVRQIAG
jgi:hypothetical protein